MDIYYKHKEIVYDMDDSRMIVDQYEFNYTENERNAFMEQHKEPRTRIMLKGSTSCKFTARLLMDHGFKMHMANPREMSEINKSYKKTDRNDARILTKKLKEGKLPESNLPSKETDGIRSLVRYRRSLAEEIDRIKN